MCRRAAAASRSSRRAPTSAGGCAAWGRDRATAPAVSRSPTVARASTAPCWCGCRAWSTGRRSGTTRTSRATGSAPAIQRHRNRFSLSEGVRNLLKCAAMIACPSRAHRRMIPAIALVLLGAAADRARAEKAPTLSAPELDALEGIARRMGEAGPDGLPALLAEALAAAELGHDERCRKAIGDASRGSAEVRAMAALNALQACRLPVWEAFGRAANKRGGLSAAPAFVAACDQKGRDQVFTGALASWRSEMEPAHYALFRALLPGLHAALLKEGSPRGRGVWSAIEHALPAVAAQLVVI